MVHSIDNGWVLEVKTNTRTYYYKDDQVQNCNPYVAKLYPSTESAKDDMTKLRDCGLFKSVRTVELFDAMSNF